MSLTSRTTELSSCSVVAVAGELDLGTADQLWSAVEVAMLRAVPLVLDLNGLTFCDSAGLAVLVRAHNAMRAAGRRLVVARPAPTVARILELSGVSQAIAVTAGLDEAYGSLAARETVTEA